MKSKIIFITGLLIFSSNCFAQQNSGWDQWTRLIGSWKGEGSGEPGQGGGTFSFAQDLDKKIIIRKSHSEYPATKDKPKIVHDDLMVVYLDVTGKPSKAIYFDNEGHTINYSITYLEKKIVLISDKVPNVPVFRLTYTLPDPLSINTKFEIAQDGATFTTYIEGKSKKVQ
jgi:hypothetical protein